MTALTLLVAALVTWFGCLLYRRIALRHQIVDVPNERSSHTVPTPRGGGIGVMLGVAAAHLLSNWVGVEAVAPSGATVSVGVYSSMLWVAGLLLLVGLLDDRLGLPVWLRFPLYALACFGALWWLLWPLALWQFLLGGLFALWLVNLYNFMDGIDGIAAAEAIFVCVAAALLSTWQVGFSDYASFCLVIAAACVGFLFLNWAPASLFLGDTGSIPLGFLLAMLSLWGAESGLLPLACWPIGFTARCGPMPATVASCPSLRPGTISANCCRSSTKPSRPQASAAKISMGLPIPPVPAWSVP